MSYFCLKNRRYIGSKYKLNKWILSLINSGCSGDSFFDIFAGTAAIAAKASETYGTIFLNDILHSNYVLYNAFFNANNINQNKISKVIENYNNLNPDDINDNYFSVNFGGKYFTKETSKLIGYIRDDIENNKNKYNLNEYYLLLASLIYATDRVANTVGHYDAYIKGSLTNKSFWMKNIKPIKVKKLKIYKEDANELATKIKADIVYIDPPYNSRQYNRFYHLLENLTKWNKPELHGVALKPKSENSSDYCKTKAPVVFADLIGKLQTKYIAVSYNNTYNPKSSSSKNKIELDEIKNILRKKGTTKTHKISHKYFNSGKTNFDNHMEYLFITKIK